MRTWIQASKVCYKFSNLRTFKIGFWLVVIPQCLSPIEVGMRQSAMTDQSRVTARPGSQSIACSVHCSVSCISHQLVTSSCTWSQLLFLCWRPSALHSTLIWYIPWPVSCVTHRLQMVPTELFVPELGQDWGLHVGQNNYKNHRIQLPCPQPLLLNVLTWLHSQ
jgi:hypothetical protein